MKKITKIKIQAAQFLIQLGRRIILAEQHKAHLTAQAKQAEKLHELNKVRAAWSNMIRS